MKIIYSSICASAIKHPSNAAVYALGLKKSLKKNSYFFKTKYFLILVNTNNFLFALRQALLRCSSNFNSLSMVVPKSLPVVFSRILLYFSP